MLVSFLSFIPPLSSHGVFCLRVMRFVLLECYESDISLFVEVSYSRGESLEWIFFFQIRYKVIYCNLLVYLFISFIFYFLFFLVLRCYLSVWIVNCKADIFSFALIVLSEELIHIIFVFSINLSLCSNTFLFSTLTLIFLPYCLIILEISV